MEESTKFKVKQRMESIKDEIEFEKERSVKEITYYENVNVAGIQMNLYYATYKDEQGKLHYELFHGKEKIGEGNKTGTQIKLNEDYMRKIEQKTKAVTPEYSLEDYGKKALSLDVKELKEKEMLKYSEMEEKKEEEGIILPGLEEHNNTQDIAKIEEEYSLTRIQRISGRDAQAVLGEDKTKEYDELYVGYSSELGTFVPVGVNGSKMQKIEGVKSYKVQQGGKDGKETYYMTSEKDPYRGGIRIDEANGDLDVTVERRSEKDPNIIEHTKINDNGHTIEEEKQINIANDTVKTEDEDENEYYRGSERVIGPKYY